MTSGPWDPKVAKAQLLLESSLLENKGNLYIPKPPFLTSSVHALAPVQPRTISNTWLGSLTTPLPPPNTIHIACMHFSWPHSFSLPCCLCSNTPFLWFSSLAIHLSACYSLISFLFKMGYGHLNPLNWVHWHKEVLSLSFAPSLLLFSSFSFPPFISVHVPCSYISGWCFIF